MSRVDADKLYRIVENMLFIALNTLYDSPRRDNNIKDFMDLMEKYNEKTHS